MFGAGNNQGNSPWGGGSNTFGAVPTATTQRGNNAFPTQSNPLFGGAGDNRPTNPGSAVFGAAFTANTLTSTNTSITGAPNPAPFGSASFGAFGKTTTPTFPTGTVSGSSGEAMGSRSGGAVFGAGPFGRGTTVPGPNAGAGTVFGTGGGGTMPMTRTGPGGGATPFGVVPTTGSGSGKGPFGGDTAGNLSAVGTGPFGTSSSASTASNVFGGAKQVDPGLNTFGAARNQRTFVTGTDDYKASPGAVFGRSNREALLTAPSSTSSLTSDTTTVFSSRGVVAAPSVFGGMGAAQAKNPAVFGAAGVNRALFGGTQAPVSQTTSAGALFGASTTPPVTTAAVFGVAPTQPTTTVSTEAVSSVFGAASSAPKTTSHSTKANPFQTHSTTAAPTASTLFGKIVSSAPESTQSVFRASTAFPSGPTTTTNAAITTTSSVEPGASALFGKTSGNIFAGKKTEARAKKGGESRKASPSLSSSTAAAGLFGKTKTAEARVEDEKSSSGKNLFGRAAEKPKVKTGLFGKDEESGESSTEGGDRRRLIQRRGVKTTESGTGRTGGLFGRALASATGRSGAAPPRVGRRTAERQEDENRGRSRESKVSPSSSGRQSSRRRSSLDDLSQHTVLAARNIPASHNNKAALKKHFSQFGDVAKLYSTPAKNQAVIHFADHESALNAKKNGRVVKPGVPPINLFWKTLASTKTASYSPEDKVSPPENREAVKQTRLGSPKKLFTAPSEVDAELASMSGADSAFGVSMKTVERPTGLATDPLAGSISITTGKTALFKGSGIRSGSGVERAKESTREKSRSVSPLNLPVRKNREPLAAESKARTRESSPVPATSGSLVSLKSLLNKKCTTVEERLEVLEARDRALKEARHAMNAGKDLATAGANRGTCMDMCPEKERYLRQARRRLTIYEIHPESEGRGLVDHSRAVKEYSRSSADQEMPLSNELRPPEVLARTMTYILNNIIQLGGDGKWSDWFEYIWSRTRSIRKDITQQQLCDQTSVKLVEKCARFHIYCAERLCEEDPAVFDEKINNENLTKCLQTLKEMYADMWTKHGQRCPNEAEFRAYVVLMNLNEGDILRETQQLRQEIRGSAQVKFALNVHAALNSDNYIRFFKLVRQGTFLNACILHRYFNQMRNRALLTFIMAYAVPGNTAQMPVDDLMRLLAFEDREEVIAYCEHYGLLSEDGVVMIARQTFSSPESAYPTSRAQLLIESRMTVSAGEVINGEPLPPNEILPPTDSFDHEGRFKPDAATLQVAQQQEERSSPGAAPGGRGEADQARIHQQIETPAPPAMPVQPPPTKHPYSNDAVKEVAKEIFLDVIKEVCTEMSQNLYQSCKAFLNMDAPLTEDFVKEQNQALVRELALEVVQEERTNREQEARARAEFSAMRERAVVQIQTELIEDVLADSVEEVATNEKRRVDEELKQDSITRCTAEIIENLIETYSRSETSAFAQDFFTNEVECKREMLARSTEATRRLRLRRFFARWKNELAGRQRLQRSMLGFPAAPSMYSPKERLERILPGNAGFSEERNAVHLGQNAWLTLIPPTELVENESELINEILRQNEEQRQKEILSRTPLDLCQITCQSLVDNFQEGAEKIKRGKRINLYWKLALCLPQVTCEDQYHYNEWLTNKLSTPCDNLPPECHHPLARVIGCNSADLPVHPHHSIQINVSVRVVDGTLLPSDVALVQRERHLQTTHGILFVLSDHQSQDSEYWEREKQRLDRILELVDCESVSVLMAGPPNLIRTCKSVLLPHYLDKVSFLHAVPFCKDVVDPVATKQVRMAIELLAGHSTLRVPVRSDWITDFLEHGLERFFFSKIQNSTYAAGGESNLDQVPAKVIELYNAAVHHLASVAGDKDLRQVTWPPPEFTHTNSDLPEASWNNSDVLEYVHDLVLSLTLPECDVTDLNDDVSWSCACSNVWLYVETVAGETNGTDVFLISRIRQVLKKTREAFQDTCYWTAGMRDAEPSGYNIPWNKILRICIDHKLACLEKLSPDTSLEQLDYNEIRVHYNPVLLDNFMAPEDWLNSTRQIPEVSILERSVRRAAKRKQVDRELRTENARKSSRQTTPVKNPVRLKLNPTEVKLLQIENMTHNLQSIISKEKSANEDYEKYLEDILREGEKPLDPLCAMPGTLL